MKIKTNLLDDYVNFVDNTKKQNKYFKIFIFLIAVVTILFLFFVILTLNSNNYNINYE